jgi:hypothetical protein
MKKLEKNNTNNFEAKKLAKYLIYGGIFALINTIVFMLIQKELLNHITKSVNILSIFYLSHSLITILAGFLLLKSKKIGLILLYVAFIFIIMAGFIKPQETIMNNIGGVEQPAMFILPFTLMISIYAVFTGFLIFIPILTLLFLISIFTNIINTKKWLKELDWQTTHK